MRALLLLIIWFISLSVDAQETSQLEADLMFYGDAMLNTYEQQNRIFAAEKFEELFETYASETNLYSSQAGFLKFISVLDEEVDAFKLISWQIKEEEGQYEYRGYILRPDGKLTKLERNQSIDKSFPFGTSGPDDWYGCYYYYLQRHSEGTYLIYGINSNGKYDNTKILDVLTLKGQEIQFGAPIFEDKESLGTFVNRLMLSYSSDASVTIKYNPGLELIIHDHLQSTLGLQAGQGVTSIPDGTYEGYFLKEGKWYYKEKIFDHIYEEAPRPKPILNTERTTEEAEPKEKKKRRKKN